MPRVVPFFTWFGNLDSFRKHVQPVIDRRRKIAGSYCYVNQQIFEAMKERAVSDEEVTQSGSKGGVADEFVIKMREDGGNRNYIEFLENYHDIHVRSVDDMFRETADSSESLKAFVSADRSRVSSPYAEKYREVKALVDTLNSSDSKAAYRAFVENGARIVKEYEQRGQFAQASDVCRIFAGFDPIHAPKPEEGRVVMFYTDVDVGHARGTNDRILAARIEKNQLSLPLGIRLPPEDISRLNPRERSVQTQNRMFRSLLTPREEESPAPAIMRDTKNTYIISKSSMVLNNDIIVTEWGHSAVYNTALKQIESYTDMTRMGPDGKSIFEILEQPDDQFIESMRWLSRDENAQASGDVLGISGQNEWKGMGVARGKSTGAKFTQNQEAYAESLRKKIINKLTAATGISSLHYSIEQESRKKLSEHKTEQSRQEKKTSQATKSMEKEIQEFLEQNQQIADLCRKDTTLNQLLTQYKKNVAVKVMRQTISGSPQNVLTQFRDMTLNPHLLQVRGRGNEQTWTYKSKKEPEGRRLKLRIPPPPQPLLVLPRSPWDEQMHISGTPAISESPDKMRKKLTEFAVNPAQINYNGAQSAQKETAKTESAPLNRQQSQLSASLSTPSPSDVDDQLSPINAPTTTPVELYDLSLTHKAFSRSIPQYTAVNMLHEQGVFGEDVSLASVLSTLPTISEMHLLTPEDINMLGVREVGEMIQKIGDAICVGSLSEEQLTVDYIQNIAENNIRKADNALQQLPGNDDIELSVQQAGDAMNALPATRQNPSSVNPQGRGR